MGLTVTSTELPEVKLLTPQVFEDERGFFLESFNQRDFEEALGVRYTFVQDNHSRSKKGVLRGLHFQVQQPQGKLIRVISGEIFDVAVDIRRNSPHFGKWTGHVLSETNRQQLWIPPGFAHGFLVVSDAAEVLYKTTDYWSPEHERTLQWNDPQVEIAWPFTEGISLSTKDEVGLSLSALETMDAVSL